MSTGEMLNYKGKMTYAGINKTIREQSRAETLADGALLLIEKKGTRI